MIRMMGCISGIAVLTTAGSSVLAQTSAAPVLSAEWARAQEVAAIRQREGSRPSPPSSSQQSVGPLASTGPDFGPVFGPDFRPAPGFQNELRAGDGRQSQIRRTDPRTPYAVIESRDIWRAGATYADRLRLTTGGDLRRLDGAPVPSTVRDNAGFEVDTYDVTYTRGWEAVRGQTASGLDVSLMPHAGLGVGDRGGSAEAGATLRIGSNLDNLAPRGSERFGDRARWYLYAAGSGRAVGYNFARTRDGDYARSGMSHDAGVFLGDASVGVAYRRGDLQGSFGVVYREIKAEGLRGGEGFDREVTEGVVGFQLSIKPDR